MKKGTKIIVMALVVVMVLAAASTALADTASYTGSAQYGFTTSSYLTKKNDTHFGTQNFHVRFNGHGAGNPETRQYTKFVIGNTVLAEGYQSSGQYAGTFTDSNRLYKGQLRLRIDNFDNPGRYIYTSGEWYLEP